MPRCAAAAAAAAAAERRAARGACRAAHRRAASRVRCGIVVTHPSASSLSFSVPDVTAVEPHVLLGALELVQLSQQRRKTHMLLTTTTRQGERGRERAGDVARQTITDGHPPLDTGSAVGRRFHVRPPSSRFIVSFEALSEDDAGTGSWEVHHPASSFIRIAQHGLRLSHTSDVVVAKTHSRFTMGVISAGPSSRRIATGGKEHSEEQPLHGRALVRSSLEYYLYTAVAPHA